MTQLAVLDFETTGTDPEEARIVTAFFGVLDAEGRVIEAHNWMVAPDGYEIPEEASAIHGVTSAQALAEGEPLDVVLGAIIDKFTEATVDKLLPVSGHNLTYDFTVLDRELDRKSMEEGIDFWLDGVVVLDSLVIDKHLDPYRKGKRNLITTAEHYGVELSEEEAHGAQADAIASGRIVQAMIPQLKQYGTPRQVHELQKEWKREQAASLQHYFRTKADPPQPNAYVDPNWPYIPRTREDGQD